MTAVHFTVLCIGSMTQSTASVALASIPSDLFSFSFGTPTEGTNWAHAYPSVFSNEPGQGDLPVPLTDYTLCLSNPGDWSSPGLNLGTTIVGSHKCGVYNYDSYFSAVILHELLHTLPVPNGDTLRTNQQFNQWVITNRPAHPYLADPANYADHSEFMVLGNEYLVYVARGGGAPSSPPPTVTVGDPVIITRPRYPQSPDDTEAVLVPQPSNTTTKVFVSYTSPVSLSGTANPIDDLLNDYVDWLLGEMVRLFQFFDGSSEFWKWLQGMGFGWMFPWFMMFAQFGDVNKFLSGGASIIAHRLLAPATEHQFGPRISWPYIAYNTGETNVSHVVNLQTGTTVCYPGIDGYYDLLDATYLVGVALDKSLVCISLANGTQTTIAPDVYPTDPSCDSGRVAYSTGDVINVYTVATGKTVTVVSASGYAYRYVVLAGDLLAFQFSTDVGNRVVLVRVSTGATIQWWETGIAMNVACDGRYFLMDYFVETVRMTLKYDTQTGESQTAPYVGYPAASGGLGFLSSDDASQIGIVDLASLSVVASLQVNNGFVNMDKDMDGRYLAWTASAEEDPSKVCIYWGSF